MFWHPESARRKGRIVNRLERFIYDRVKNNPKLKSHVVALYQRTLSLLPTSPLVTKHKVLTREGYFFGFHDKSPWSSDDSKLLAHRYETPLRLPNIGEAVDVGYFSAPDYAHFQPVAKTTAWNWQQGAMLQWVGRGHTLLFNDFDGSRHVARVIDASGESINTIAQPIGALSPCGCYGLSYSFERLRQGMPGYGYAAGHDPNEHVLLPDNEAGSLVLVDVTGGQSHPLWTLRKIAAIEPERSMQGAFHFFTHCLFAPSGKRFVFYHRWLDPSGRLWTRMLSSNLQGEELHIFPTDGMVSHIGWQDNEHILAYSRPNGRDDGYYLFRDKSEDFVPIGQGYFTADGHPQFAPNGKCFVTDTYPDRRRVQRLIIYDVEAKCGRTIARFRSPLKFRGELRVDLHPRWNRQGTTLAVDSAHTGKRALCIVENVGLACHDYEQAPS